MDSFFILYCTEIAGFKDFPSSLFEAILKLRDNFSLRANLFLSFCKWVRECIRFRPISEAALSCRLLYECILFQIIDVGERLIIYFSASLLTMWKMSYFCCLYCVCQLYTKATFLFDVKSFLLWSDKASVCGLKWKWNHCQNSHESSFCWMPISGMRFKQKANFQLHLFYYRHVQKSGSRYKVLLNFTD